MQLVPGTERVVRHICIRCNFIHQGKCSRDCQCLLLFLLPAQTNLRKFYKLPPTLKDDFQSVLHGVRTLMFINIINSSLDGMRIDVIHLSATNPKIFFSHKSLHLLETHCAF